MSRFFKTDGWFDGHLHISEYSRRIYGHEQNPRAHVILGGVDTEVFSPTPSVRCAGAALFVGRLLPHKGVDDLIRAAEADLPVELACQPYDQRYYALLQELAADKPVRFNFACDGTPAGNVELVAAYRRSLCVVLPSVYRTCFGNETRVPELLGQTLLEGMACGIPAICTNVASMPEVVVDGVTGFVVPPNDPTTLGARLRWLKTHPEQARAMGQAAREHVLKRFTWRSVVDRCLAIYAGDKGSR